MKSGDHGDGTDPPEASESRLERRIWIAVYVVVLMVLAAGAARRLAAMF